MLRALLESRATACGGLSVRAPLIFTWKTDSREVAGIENHCKAHSKVLT